jgi:sugar/nucleoside kinase (ribokinase family)
MTSSDLPLEVLVSGYASIDDVYHASRLAGPAQSSTLTGPVLPPTRPGGCGPNTARSLAGLGIRVGLVTWLGNDPGGRAFLAGLAEAGVDVTGVELGAGSSPRSLMIYDANGEAACYFHPSGSDQQRITPEVEILLGSVPWLAVTVGSQALTEQLLDRRDAGTHLAWALKSDPGAFPLGLCRRLVRADLICLNQRELAFVGGALGLQADTQPMDLVEQGARCVALTRGTDGYTVATAAGVEEVSVEGLSVEDPTGAGDAFFAGVLAGLIRGEEPINAAANGARVARAHLLAQGVPSSPREVPA